MNIDSKISRKPPVLLLFGPTAVGKSEILYNLLNPPFEIINADSLQVYKYLDIGTAKPAPEQLACLPHHLIDILPPSAHFTAGDFIRRAEDCIRAIHLRGGIPVLSGGTAFYLKSFLYGLPSLPGKSEAIRRELSEELKRSGNAALYETLCRVDPAYAAKIAPGDSNRLVRALEVYRLCGRPLSSFQLPDRMRDDYSLLLIGLQRPREELNQRIDRRVEVMFRDGLVAEIKGIFKRGFGEDDPALKGIGYREFFLMQKTCLTLEGVKALIQRNSRQYARRQMTFFRRFERVRWFHPKEETGLKAVLKEFVAGDFTEPL